MQRRPYATLIRAWLLAGAMLLSSTLLAATTESKLLAAVKDGNPPAMLALGLYYMDLGNGQKTAKAAEWLRKATLSDHPETSHAARQALRKMQRDLILRAQVDRDLTLDPAIPSAGAALFATDDTDAAIDLLIREAWLLNEVAGEYLQILYEEPIEAFPQFDPRIRSFFVAAADEGLPAAQVFVGRMHLYGLGFPVDREKGIGLLEGTDHPLARMELAQYALALRNEPLAASHWLAAADRFAYAPALYNLGVRSMRNGNNSVAGDYFERALKSDPSHYGARLELARLLGSGEDGDALDPKRSLQLLESVAAEAHGRVRLIALANLGLFYLEGIHVAPDRKRALALFREAEAGGLDSVSRYIRQLEEQLN